MLLQITKENFMTPADTIQSPISVFLNRFPSKGVVEIKVQFSTEAAAQSFFDAIPKELQEILNARNNASSPYQIDFNVNEKEADSSESAFWVLLRNSGIEFNKVLSHPQCTRSSKHYDRRVFF